MAGRAMLCQPLAMFPVECVARGYLTGSGLVEYRASGSVCGVPLPAGLVDGSRLPEPIFTPATKAELGDHDENVDFDAVVGRRRGRTTPQELRRLTLAVYARAEEIARERGLILADTKFEFGRPGADAGASILLADEVLTPDSSRFWPADAWQPGRPGAAVVRQAVRARLADLAGLRLGPHRAASRRRRCPTRSSSAPAPCTCEAYERLTGRRWA